jgi:hypothetical protein
MPRQVVEYVSALGHGPTNNSPASTGYGLLQLLISSAARTKHAGAITGQLRPYRQITTPRLPKSCTRAVHSSKSVLQAGRPRYTTWATTTLQAMAN